MDTYFILRDFSNTIILVESKNSDIFIVTAINKINEYKRIGVVKDSVADKAINELYDILADKSRTGADALYACKDVIAYSNMFLEVVVMDSVCIPFPYKVIAPPSYGITLKLHLHSVKVYCPNHFIFSYSEDNDNEYGFCSNLKKGVLLFFKDADDDSYKGDMGLFMYGGEDDDGHHLYYLG